MNKELRILALVAMLLLIPVCKSDRPGTLKWKYKTGGPIESSPAIGPDGTVYITSMDSCLYAFDPEGNLKWKYQADGYIYSSPVIGTDGTIYVNPWDVHTYAISSEGKLKWKCETWYTPASPAIGQDGTIYVVGDNGRLYAISPEGELKWESLLKKGYLESWFPPAIGIDGILYISIGNVVYAVDTLGNLKWNYEIPGTWSYMVISSMAIDGEGNIYFCTEPSIVGGFCVLTNQGKLRANLAYSQHVMTSEWSAPVIATDGTIYFGGLSFYVLNSDYTLETRFKGIQYGSESTTTIGSDGTLYVGTSKWEDVSTPKMHQVGYLSAAASDGKLKWRYKVGGGIKSSPAIGSDGTVYIGSLDSCVYAIRSDSKGLADSPWPKFQHDNQNTGRAGGGM